MEQYYTIEEKNTLSRGNIMPGNRFAIIRFGSISFIPSSFITLNSYEFETIYKRIHDGEVSGKVIRYPIV